jgi:hypothetical protein
MDHSSSHNLHIPLELHREIYAQCDTSALAVYARVDRATWNICTTILYRDVELKSLKKTVQFCKALIHNPKLAERVQKLDIFKISRVHLLAAFAALFKSAFRMLRNLTKFSIRLAGVSERDFCDVNSHHPKLQILSTTTPLNECLCRWLEKQENLESISINSPMLPTFDKPRRDSLRNLRRVAGNPANISWLLLPGSRVEHIDLTIILIEYLSDPFLGLLVGAMSNLRVASNVYGYIFFVTSIKM